jgi:hypothetical protein
VGSLKFDTFYDPNGASRLLSTFHLLTRYDLSTWALTGGTAIEFYLQQMGAPTCVRPLHDLDFIAASFDCLPAGLGRVLLLRHVHPKDPPAKTMLQAVDPSTSVRIDVFRAYGAEMKRAQSIELEELMFQIVSFEDLVARHARLCCALLRGKPVAPKFARDFLRMVGFPKPENMEYVWQDHRESEDPTSFAEATGLLLDTIDARTDLLIPPVYSTDLAEVCVRCESTSEFQLADAKQVFALLGYC